MRVVIWKDPEINRDRIQQSYTLVNHSVQYMLCLLYTSDAADE